MKRLAACAAFLLSAAAAFGVDVPPEARQPRRPLERADVLPLALDDAFEFRKFQHFLNDPKLLKPTVNPMLQFERARANFGAVTNVDRMERRGHYFTFFWRTARPAPITVRFEYRQENLGAFVQAREVSYERAKGSMTTKFEIVGDDYFEDGRITAWRALLIADNRIVGLTQSYLWR